MTELLKSYRKKVRLKQHDQITDEERAANNEYSSKYKKSRALASASWRLRQYINTVAQEVGEQNE